MTIYIPSIHLANLYNNLQLFVNMTAFLVHASSGAAANG